MDLGFCETCLFVAGTRTLSSKHQCHTSRPRVLDRTSRSQAYRVQRLIVEDDDLSGPHQFESDRVKVRVKEAWGEKGCEVVRLIPWEKVFSVYVPTSSYVPPSLGFQNALSSLLIVGLASICDNSDSLASQDDSLKLFFLMAKILFGKCQGSNKFPKKAEIRRRLALFLHGRLGESDTVRCLLKDCIPVQASEMSEAGAEVWRLKRSQALVSLGLIAKGYNTVCSDMLPARVDVETLEEVRRLHPSAQLPVFDRSVLPGVEDGVVDVGFLKEDFTSALLGSVRGLAAGPSGWRFEYLLALSHKGIVDRERLLDLLFKFSVLVCQGALPTCVGEYFFGGNLTLLRKPGPERGLRPICVGEVFVRLIGSAIAKHNASGFEKFFLPLGQLGVATSAGAEAIVHAVRLASMSHPDWVVLQLDFRNAFNTISRVLVEQQLKLYFPSLLSYFYSRYGRASRIQVGSEVILSTSGVHQGDPLGPFFFALGLAAVMRVSPDPDLTSSSGLFLAYLDDLVLCGPPSEVAAALNRYLRAASTLQSGLEINVHKSVLWSPSRSPVESKAVLGDADSSLLDVSALKTPGRNEGVVVLGAPIGSPTFVKASSCERYSDQTGRCSRASAAHEVCPMPRFTTALLCGTEDQLSFASCPAFFVIGGGQGV